MYDYRVAAMLRTPGCAHLLVAGSFVANGYATYPQGFGSTFELASSPCRDLGGEYLSATHAIVAVAQPTLSVGDVDGDGSDDFILLGYDAYQSLVSKQIYLYSSPGGTSFSVAFPTLNAFTYNGPPSIGDANGDGCDDVFFIVDAGLVLLLSLPSENVWDLSPGPLLVNAPMPWWASPTWMRFGNGTLPAAINQGYYTCDAWTSYGNGSFFSAVHSIADTGFNGTIRTLFAPAHLTEIDVEDVCAKVLQPNGDYAIVVYVGVRNVTLQSVLLLRNTTFYTHVVPLNYDGEEATDIGVFSDVSSTIFRSLFNGSFVVADDAFDGTVTIDNRGVPAAGDLSGDGLDDLFLYSNTGSCQFKVLYNRAPPPSLTTGEESTGTVSGAEGDSSSSVLATVLGSVGGAVALIGLVCGACCFAAICVVVLAVACVACVVVAVLILALVASAVVVVVAGAVAIAGGGGGGTLFAVRRQHRQRADELWQFDEPAEDAAEVRVRMDETNEFRRIEYDEITLGRKIGEGAYGTVFAGEWQGVKVAVKVISGALTQEALRDFEHEAVMMSKVSHHPHVVQFIGASVEDERLAMVLRFYLGGSLDTVLRTKRLGEATKLRILAETASAVAFLHSIGIIHRDIAVRNVLLDCEQSAKLADLGLARQLEDGADAQSTKSNVGPVRWMPPEAMTDRNYSSASDAWSFGVLMWEVWSDGDTPYGDLASVADVATAVIREGRTLAAPDSCPANLRDILSYCFRFDASTRPTMVDVLEAIQL